jgi:hypothetical protein
MPAKTWAENAAGPPIAYLFSLLVCRKSVQQTPPGTTAPFAKIGRFSDSMSLVEAGHFPKRSDETLTAKDAKHAEKNLTVGFPLSLAYSAFLAVSSRIQRISES